MSQLEDGEFEGYPGISYENGREHLNCRLGSEELHAMELADKGKVMRFLEPPYSPKQTAAFCRAAMQ